MEYERRNRAQTKAELLTGAEARDERPAEDSSFSILRNNVIEAIRILVLRRWAFLIPFCLIVCTASVASHWIPRTYMSTTSIERRDHPVLMNLRQTVATGGFARFFRPTLVGDLRSLDAMIEVVDNLRLVEDAPRHPDGTLTKEGGKMCRAKAGSLVSGVKVQLMQRTDHLDQIKITYEGADPSLPQRLVSEVKDTYIRRTRAKLAAILHEGKNYFENVANQKQQQISDLEEDLLKFQAEYIGIDPTNPSELKLKLTSLETERAVLDRDIATFQREIDARRHLLGMYTERRKQAARANASGSLNIPQIAKSPEAQGLEEEIRTLQREIHDLQLQRRMTERHPDIVERRKRITRLRESLKARYLADAKALPANRSVALDDSTADHAVEAAVGWDMEIAGMQMDIQDRVGRLEYARTRQRTLEEDIAKHQTLESNIYRYRKEYHLKATLLDQARGDYQTNSRRTTEISSILAADASERGIEFTELTRPTAARRPIKPRGMTALVLSLLAGLAAGAASVLLRELFDQTYHTTKQVARSLGIAILESVDEIITSADRARLFRRRVIYAPVLVTCLLGAVSVCCAAAYLSLERPYTYERVMRVPRSIWSEVRARSLFADQDAAGSPSETATMIDGTAHQESPAVTVQTGPGVSPQRVAG